MASTMATPLHHTPTSALFSILITLLISACAAEVRYVKPENENETNCYGLSPCYPLGYYVGNSSSYFTSDTTFQFLPGTHVLDSETSKAVLIENVTRLSLIGNASIGSTDHPLSPAEIHCQGTTGFAFVNAFELTLENLTFIGCGQVVKFSLLNVSSTRAALAFDIISELRMYGIVVRNSSGFGIYAQRVFGNSSIVNSSFAYNTGSPNYDGGNAIFWYANCPQTTDASLLFIGFSEFLYGHASHINPLATGLTLWLECTNIDVDVNNVTLIGNTGENSNTGGNLAIFYRNDTDIIRNSVTVRNSYVAEGSAYYGGGMYVSLLDTPTHNENPRILTFLREAVGPLTNVSIPELLSISNNRFVNNHARFEGGGLYIIVHEVMGAYDLIGRIIVQSCTFESNTMLIVNDGGIAAHIINNYTPEFLPHGIPQFEVLFIKSMFSNNQPTVTEGSSSTFSSQGSAVVFIVQDLPGTTFIDCAFTNNNSTAITSVRSNLIFQGNITLQGNTGVNGGGLILCDRSYMYLKPHTNMRFTNNHAKHSGGAIYAEDQCLQSKPACFFQVILNTSQDLDTIHVELANTSAEYAGSALYGGSVDYCFVFGAKKSGPDIFDEVFEIEPYTGPSTVTSNPFTVCFCNENLGTPDCSIESLEKTVFPGQNFNVCVVVVGQRNGPAPGVVLSDFANRPQEGNSPTLGNLQDSQKVATTCTELNYTVYSSSRYEEIILMVQQTDGIQSRMHPRYINVSLYPCPVGFSLRHNRADCNCAPVLADNGVKCRIDYQTIHRRTPTWIGYHFAAENVSDGIIFHQHCPLDFCKSYDINISTNIEVIHQDEQCNSNRTGILCGACPNTLSLVLGSSKCLPCSNLNLLLLIPFALAGLLLVVFLIACNLTVSEGTINGLIFYANIVQINSHIFFKSEHVTFLTELLTVFIAWLNLDLGIQTCFYDGMDAYAKTWLQFAFPIYIWLIAGLMIFLSKNTTIAKLVGTNAVKVLATLFLLSYAKLQRTIIVACSFTIVSYSNAEESVEWPVWMHNADIPYLRGKHILLFIIAVAFGILSLPYTITLLFVQWLQKKSNIKLFRWVEKIMPMLDAYAGPYKDRYRFWTGLLLLMRIIIFTSFAANLQGEPQLNLMVTTLASVFLLMLGWIFTDGIYKVWPLNILESSFFANLAVLSAATAYVISAGGPSEASAQSAVTYTSVSIALVTFMGILLYHVYMQYIAPRLSNCVSLPRQREEEEVTLTEGRSSDVQESGLMTSANEFNEYREPLLAYQDS